MNGRHAMTYERGGMKKAKRKGAKTSRKRSAVSGQRLAVSRKLRAAKHQAMNILAGIGIIAVVVWMFQFVIGQ